MHVQRTTAEYVIAAGGNSPKGSRGNVKLYMDDPQLSENISVSEEFVEKGHGRIEIRNGCVKQRSAAGVCRDIDWLHRDRPSPAAFGAGDTKRNIGGAPPFHHERGDGGHCRRSERIGESIASGARRHHERRRAAKPDGQRDAKHRGDSRKILRRCAGWH